ncbi:P-loop containing nucleoside triphosphate hydrolase protein [Scheffersomyces amazonensis]|uniref:P-loop containing nucleoside triphosphate hydrolase protein n=1 Tax=Scheffersomyces amazonensis TaxID=1078765 RepID=UPI00315D54A9
MSSISISIEYLKSSIDEYDFKKQKKPIIIGLSGPQGSGKSYLAEHLTKQLQTTYEHLNFVQFSMDDLYLKHVDQVKLNDSDNLLLRGRGLPGTHDINIGVKIFDQLINSHNNNEDFPIIIPTYDKSAFNGEGDRFDSSNWKIIDKPVDVIIFEGWFNGFEPLDEDQLRLSYLTSEPSGIVQHHKLYHLEQINESLKQYQAIWKLFDKFIFIHTTDINNVYTWRIQQEHALIKLTGRGMTDDKIVKFVDRYMPMYHLYYERMCDKGVVKTTGNNLRLSIDIERNITKSTII